MSSFLCPEKMISIAKYTVNMTLYVRLKCSYSKEKFRKFKFRAGGQNSEQEAVKKRVVLRF